MGIDNESLLVFGILLSYKEATNKFPEGFWDTIDMWDQEVVKNFNDIFFGYASPGYNADCTECTYFISLIEPNNTQLTCEEIGELVMKWKETSYIECLQQYDIEFAEPVLVSLPNVY